MSSKARLLTRAEIRPAVKIEKAERQNLGINLTDYGWTETSTPVQTRAIIEEIVDTFIADGRKGKIVFPRGSTVSIPSPIGYNKDWSALDMLEIDLNESTVISVSGYFDGNCGLYIHSGILSCPGQFTQGVVTNVQPGYFEFQADPLFAPSFSSAATLYRVDLDRNAVTGKKDTSSYALTSLGGGVYRAATAPPAWMTVGDKVVLLKQKYGASGLYNRRTAGTPLRVEDVTVIGAPGMFVYWVAGKDVEVKNANTRYQPGAWHCVNADFLHFQATRGQVDVEDVDVAGLGDDALNIHAVYWTAITQSDADTVVCTVAGPPPLVGDRVAFLSSEMVTLGHANVTSASGGTWSGGSIVGVTINFDAPIPGAFNPATGSILNLSDLPTSVNVDNLTAARVNARAALIQARRASVRGIKGVGILGSLINVGTGTFGFPTETGSAAESVIVDDYQAIDCGFMDGETIGQHQINVKSLTISETTAGDGPTRGVIIGKGEIIRCGFGALAVEGGEVTIVGLQMRETGGLRTGGASAGEHDVHITSGKVTISSMIHKQDTGKLYIDAASAVRAGPDAIIGFSISGPSGPVIAQSARQNYSPSPRMDRWINGNLSPTINGNAQSALGPDRFTFFGPAGGVWTRARSEFTLGQTAVPGRPRYYLQIGTTTNVAGEKQVIIEVANNVEELSGQTILVGLWLRSDNPGASYTLRTFQSFGPGGSATVVGEASAAIVPDGTWRYYVRAVKVPSVAGKTRGSTSGLLRIDLVTTGTVSLSIGPNSISAGVVTAPIEPFATPAPLYLEVADGVSAVGAVSGIARQYVDSADGDLKEVFSDGIVKIIVADT